MRGTRTIHIKQRLIPLLYHTRGGTLKNPYSASFVEHARVTSLPT